MTKDRILVVDDELDNRVMMRYFLESWGFEVELAANGREALEKVAANPPQLVLLDLEMPVMDGFDTCDRLKSNQATEQIPVIMFTGLEQTADKVRGLRRGADDYVVKTVDPEELQARIEMILRRAKRFESKAPAAGAGNGRTPLEDHAVSGSLAELYFPEAMQLILAYGKTGVLRLQDGEREGRVYLKEGQVVHAEFEQKQGEEAFYDLALWRRGHFGFQVGEQPAKSTINKSGTNLLIEATRRLDEWNMISGKIPSFDVVPARVPLSGGDTIRLTAEDWKILVEMDGRRSIRSIAEKLGMDLFEAGRMVFNLLTVGVVSIDKHAAQSGVSSNVPQLAVNAGRGEPFQLSALQWRIISYIDGKRDLAALASLAGVPLPRLVETLRDLVKQGLVHVAPGGRREGRPARQGQVTMEQKGQRAQQGNVAPFQPRARAMGLD